MPPAASHRPRPSPGPVAAAPRILALLLLLSCCAGICRGAPISSQGLLPEQELRLWNEAYSALEKLCFMITGTLPKPQKTDEKDNTKRFLFHYSKMRKLGNSNVSSVVHPLLQLVPQLQERRMKRFRVDEEFQGPIASQRRRYFLFRPRNGRRSEDYI
ncbi:neuromedin U [Rhinolophus ferrumequinum]|uniref:Neuromedin U n=1 Tax=Rhinolophus ferrumequinum TaxID=59479 RepID=A0A7J7ZD00_RHIFE|nr:neuromedin U [Rhinolophus ferrumequinum]